MRLRAGLVAFAVCVVAGSAEAGPWATGRGHSYFKASYGFLNSNELANPDGSNSDIPDFLKQEVNLYAAVGLSSKWTAIGLLPIVRSSDLEDFGRETGFGDVQFGLQYQLGGGNSWAFAARAIAQAPTGDEERASGLLPTGTGVWETDMRLSVGGSFAGGRLYAFGEGGYLYRDTLRDAFVYDTQIGWNVGQRLVLAWSFRGVEPFDQAPEQSGFGSPVGFGDGVRYLSFGPTAIVKLGGGWGAQIDVTGVARTRNLARGTQFTFGLSYSR